VSKFIAIDLAPDGIYVVSGSTRGSHAKIEHALSWTEADGAAPPQLSRESARPIGEHLRDRLKAAGVASAPVLVSVSRGRVILKELRYPAVPPTEEPAVVRFQAMKELSDSPEDVVLDYAPLSNGSPEGERRSMAVVIRKELYSAIQQMCAAANLRLAAVTPRPYAIAAGLNRALATGLVPVPESKADAVATLVLSPAGGEFTIARNGEVTFTSEVPGPVVTSEPMLLGDIRRKLTVYAGGAPGHPVQGVYVAEAASVWSGRLRAALGLPVNSYDPLAGAAPDVPEALRGRFAGAVGLLAAKAADAIPINFAAPRQPVVAKDPKQRQLILAALAAMVLLGAGALYGWMTLSAADDRLGSLQQKKTDLENKFKNSEPNAKRLEAANKWKSRRVNWLDELFDETDRFAEASEKLRSSDKFTAASFEGHAIPPDSKSGNQPNQAKMDLKVASTNVAAVNAIVDAMNREGVDKTRFYVGVDKTQGGFSQGSSTSKDYTVHARVNGRPPEQYTRFPSFKSEDRGYYNKQVRTGAATRAPKEKTDEKTEPEPAPGPKEKPKPEEDDE
jgi:hypothetical protein